MKNINIYYLYLLSKRIAVTLVFMLLCSTAKSYAQDSLQSNSKTIYGTASYYSNKFIGRKTANGELFDQTKLTAASNKFPLGKWVRVTNLRNGRTVNVRINDRMNRNTKRVIDLTLKGAKKLGFIKSGITKVKMEALPGLNEFKP